jgi:hypothetical protein
LRLRARQARPHALDDRAALELGDLSQDVHLELAGGRRGVDAFAERDERYAERCRSSSSMIRCFRFPASRTGCCRRCTVARRAPVDSVRRVVLPRRGPKSPARHAYEHQRWFRRGQHWRVGYKSRISALKRRHELDRCRYHGSDGMYRWVGLGVIANNLVSTATFSKARAAA